MKSTVYSIMFLAFGLLHFEITKAATGDITGQIIEKETMAPVAYAEVTLDNGTTKTIITANEYGQYSAKHLATGKYNVLVKYDNRVVAMNAIHIKDSYTVGINLIVSSIAPTVEIKDAKKDNATGALRQHDEKFVMPVKATQGPIKAPMASLVKKIDFLMDVNPLVIALKSPMA